MGTIAIETNVDQRLLRYGGGAMLLLIRERVWDEISEQFSSLDQLELSKWATETAGGFLIDESRLSMRLKIRIQVEVGYANGRMDKEAANKLLPTKDDL